MNDENGLDTNPIRMLPPPPARLDEPPKKPSRTRPELIRAALLLQARMAEKGWDINTLCEKLRPELNTSSATVQNWFAAESAPSAPFREAVGRILDLDPDLLLPDNETEVARNRREIRDKGVRTRLANKFSGKHRPSRWENLATAVAAAAAPAEPEPETLTPLAEPEPPAASAALGDEYVRHTVDYLTGMAELRVFMRRRHPQLQALADLLGQELESPSGAS